MSEDRCVICGEIVPEGRMVCHGEMVQIAEGKKNKTPRYIDANKLIELANHEGAYGYVDVHDIYSIPPADVVERKKAEWEICGSFDDLLRCSNCRFIMPMIAERFNFCPDCGADMRKEKTDGKIR